MASTPPAHRIQRWTTVPALAAYFGVSRRTATRWVAEGLVRAVPAPLHYTDDRPRATSRRKWRIYEDDVMRLVEAMRGRTGTPLPVTLWGRDD